MNIILASSSPRRRQLLEQMGIRAFQVRPSDIDETVDQTLPPAQIVEELSRQKARAVAAQAGPDDLIIAADTIVALDGAVLGKPADDRQAAQMLRVLSGKRHQVYTGVTLRQGDRAVTAHESTTVAFRRLTGEEIADYVSTGEPRDKAGAYGIQGVGALLVEGLEGDYFNVMGLPVCRLGRMLDEFGVDCLKLAGR